MNIEDLLEQIETVLDAGKTVPLSSKLMIDADAVRTSIEDIRLNMPKEIKQARAVAAEHKEIISMAKREAEGTNKSAEERAREIVRRAEEHAKKLVEKAEFEAESLVEEHEITKTAEMKAKELLEVAHTKAQQIVAAAELNARETQDSAYKWAHEMRTAASNFVEDIMQNSDEVLSSNIAEIRRARQNLKSASNNALKDIKQS